MPDTTTSHSFTVTKRRPPFQVAGLDATTTAKFRRGASVRGWTLAKYLKALVELHERCRAIADSPLDQPAMPENIRAELQKLGLQSIRE